MAVKSLAIKYRPKTFDDVVEQEAIKTILSEQIRTGTIKNAYLLCGSAGTGKTTCARIIADNVNDGQGTPIEMDAASNSSVDDVRNIIKQAQTKSLDSEYKVFIIDECHSLSNTAWQAFLKLLEEPPLKSIFIFCTTDPQKIPKTILSRVQRYDFQRISQQSIVDRLKTIIALEDEEILCEGGPDGAIRDWCSDDALEYIAKIADGGMRDAITLMDKCLSYSNELTLENVVKALGIANYDVMFSLVDSLIEGKTSLVLEQIDSIHKSGVDMKQFMRQFTEFVLDICKYGLTCSFSIIRIPNTYATILKDYGEYEYDTCRKLLEVLVALNTDIKWDTNPKYAIEARLFMFSEECNGKSNTI